MIVAFDIETIGNKDAVALMPEPEVKTGNLKDPDKIAAKIAEAKAEVESKAALDPLTARVAAYAMVGESAEYVTSMATMDDAGERAILQEIMQALGQDEMRLASWNGIGFDLPMVYKRAMVLGVDPGDFGAPPLSAWTKRYAADRHYDLMQIWGGWRDFVKLDIVAGMVLGARKVPFDVTTIPDLLASPDGRKQVEEYCLQDTRLTWALFKKFNGCFFQ